MAKGDIVSASLKDEEAKARKLTSLISDTKSKMLSILTPVTPAIVASQKSKPSKISIGFSLVCRADISIPPWLRFTLFSRDMTSVEDKIRFSRACSGLEESKSGLARRSTYASVFERDEERPIPCA